MAKTTFRVAGRRSHICAKCRGEILPGQQYRAAGTKKYHHAPDCAHAEPREPWHATPIPDDPYWKLFRAERWRFVRCLPIRIARRNYDCWSCLNSHSIHQQMLANIFAGDEYNSEVWVSQYGWEMRRYHMTCPWDPTEDDDREEEDESEDSDKSAAA